MNIIIPMAGSGQRFVDNGYKDPKPAIIVDGKRIIEHVVEPFSEEDRYIFICNEKQNENKEFIDLLKNIRKNTEIIVMPCHKKGPVYTVMAAFNKIKDDEPVIIAYCDGSIKFNVKNFETFVNLKNLDGCLFTHTGFHPHTISKTKMAFIKEENEKVIHVKEKAHYTDNPQQEHASSGIYYFKNGALVKKYFQQTINENINYNGEHYITLVYNLLIEDNLNVGFYDTDYVLILGTPEEVKNYEAWLTICRNECIKTNDDVVKLYQYWKKFIQL